MNSLKKWYQPRIFLTSLTSEKRGQSLVEFAIVVPILLLMMLGVFEVGFALRNYLALANVNREATRFAARGIYLDFDEKSDPYSVGYEKVVSHTVQSLANQLPLDMFGPTPNSTQIITLYRVEPGNFNCEGDATCAGFQCSRFDYENRNEGNFVAGETLNDIEYPILWTDNASAPNLPDYYQKVLTMSNTTALSSYHYYRGANDIYSRIDPAEMVFELRSRSNYHNCELVKKKQPPTKSDYIVVENIYFQKPLVGLLPFVGDSVPMYTHTVMRVTSNIRETITESVPECALYPMMIPASKVPTSDGAQVEIGISNDTNPVAGNFNWVRWNADENPANNQCDHFTICDNLKNPDNIRTDFLEPDSDPPDTEIGVRDWVSVMPGVNNSNALRNELETLENKSQVMWMPVWDDSDCASATGCSYAELTGSGGKYRVMTFVKMRVTEVNYQNAPRSLEFQYLGTSSNHCAGMD